MSNDNDVRMVNVVDPTDGSTTPMFLDYGEIARLEGELEAVFAVLDGVCEECHRARPRPKPHWEDQND
jgi:hypothetical protein